MCPGRSGAWECVGCGGRRGGGLPGGHWPALCASPPGGVAVPSSHLGWPGGHGGWGGGEPRHTARGEVACPSLGLLCKGNKAGLHCVAQAMKGAASILLPFVSVCSRLGAAQRGLRGAACCLGGSLTEPLAGGLNRCTWTP